MTRPGREVQGVGSGQPPWVRLVGRDRGIEASKLRDAARLASASAERRGKALTALKAGV